MRDQSPAQYADMIVCQKEATLTGLDVSTIVSPRKIMESVRITRTSFLLVSQYSVGIIFDGRTLEVESKLGVR